LSFFSLKNKKIFVAGHRGMVGAALVRQLQTRGAKEILTATRDELDLLRQQAVEDWMQCHHPDVVIIAAAKVGGIAANNDYPADFIYQNLCIETNLIKAAADIEVEKLLFLGSSCIYPKYAEQPIREEALLEGALEPTNEAYAIAKIAGIKLCQAFRQQYTYDFIAAQPCNLYGPGDNYDLNSSHVLPALIRKTHEAKLAGKNELIVWGTGQVYREFLHVDDCASGLLFLLENYSDLLPINIGSGTEITIADLAQLVCQIIGFEGQLIFDHSKPDGTPRKLMDSTRLHRMGWQPALSLAAGIKHAYAAFLQNGF